MVSLHAGHAANTNATTTQYNAIKDNDSMLGDLDYQPNTLDLDVQHTEVTNEDDRARFDTSGGSTSLAITSEVVDYRAPEIAADTTANDLTATATYAADNEPPTTTTVDAASIQAPVTANVVNDGQASVTADATGSDFQPPEAGYQTASVSGPVRHPIIKAARVGGGDSHLGVIKDGWSYNLITGIVPVSASPVIRLNPKVRPPGRPKKDLKQAAKAASKQRASCNAGQALPAALAGKHVVAIVKQFRDCAPGLLSTHAYLTRGIIKITAGSVASTVKYLEEPGDTWEPDLVVGVLPESLTSRARAEITSREGNFVNQTAPVSSTIVGVQIGGLGRYTREQIDAMQYLHTLKRAAD